MDERAKSRVAEIAMMFNRGRAQDTTRELLDDDLIEFLVGIKPGSKGIEIMGRLGFIAEYLSQKGSIVKLVDEDNMFFVYRGHLFPKSKVVDMNLHPSSIKSKTQHYDFAIIHSDEFIDLAKDIATTVYQVEKREIYTKKKEEVKNEKVVVNSDKVVANVPKIKDDEKPVAELPKPASVDIPTTE